MNITIVVLNVILFYVCAIALAVLTGLLLSIIKAKIDER